MILIYINIVYIYIYSIFIELLSCVNKPVFNFIFELTGSPVCYTSAMAESSGISEQKAHGR